MITGTGIDIVHIERFSGLDADAGLLRRCFTEGEQRFFATKHYRAESIAGVFAAKEAYAKARGLGLGALGLKNIEILHDDRGKPYIVYHAPSAAATDPCEINEERIHLSISHDGGIAVASVVLERL